MPAPPSRPERLNARRGVCADIMSSNRLLRGFIGYGVVPFLFVSLLFFVLLMIRDPSLLAGSWPLAPIAGAFIATVGYAAHLIGQRLRHVEPWRDML